METTKLNNGITVYAKNGKAASYANRTQAAKQAEKITGATIYQATFSRVFYVKVN